MKNNISAIIIVSLFCLITNKASASLITDINTETINYNITTGGFGWTASYDIGFVDQNLFIDVDVFLTGFTPSDALRDIWEFGIEDIWSSAFDIFDGTYYYDTVFNVDWLSSSSGADHTVNVHEGDGNINLTNWYTGNPSGWGYSYQGIIAAHEFGHMLGLFDEYNGGALDPNTGLIRSDSIMGGSLTDPQTDHFDAFLDWTSTKTGSKFFLVDDSGDHFYQSTIETPEPSTIAIFILALIGLLFQKRYKAVKNEVNLILNN